MKAQTSLVGGIAGRLVFCHAALFALALPGSALAADPFAFNNTVYPEASEWSGSLRPSNYNYPTGPVAPSWVPGGGVVSGSGGLTQATAPAYAAAVKAWLGANNISGLVSTPLEWNPIDAGWYDMPWGGEGSPQGDGTINPESGREPILGSYAGQIIQTSTFYPLANEPNMPESFQNHSVVYYNDVAGAMLGEVWSNPFQPDVGAVCGSGSGCFPEGSVIVKVEGAALEWDVLEGSAVSYVYRPTAAQVEASMEKHPAGLLKAEVVPMYFAQMAVKVRDSVAAPETGWVFLGFTYDKSLPGSATWDKTVAVGITWGNDPNCTSTPDGYCPGGMPVTQTWVNPAAPEFTAHSLGWGGRLAAPMDVARRHNVVTVSGKRYSGVGNELFPASSCVSCHGSAQYPFVANLYPSPNLVFPEDGQQFLFFDPGSDQWAGWFQNRPGNVAMSGAGHSGIVSLDYDMMLTLALMSALGGAGEDAFLNNLEFGH